MAGGETAEGRVAQKRQDVSQNLTRVAVSPMACRVPALVNRRSTASLAAALLLFASAGCKKDEGTRAARYLADGDRLVHAGQYREASVAYRRAAALTPASVDVVEKLADAAARSRQPDLAADASLKLAELQPENGTAQLRAASIYLLAGQYDESIARAEAAVQANGADPNARIVLGEALAGVHEQARSEAAENVDRDLSRLPAGCSFAPRCPFVIERCRAEVPPLDLVGADHLSACWVASELGKPVPA